ncbi:MAG: hypothetical protein K8R99_15100 [Actinomycetia bacterium]|nr:hypothetical protein [Actinomycetes bacterium]
MTDEQPIPGGVSNGRSGPSITLIFFLVVIGLAAVFFLQNSETVPIDFLVFEKETTIRWSLLMAVALGILIDRIFSIWWRRRGTKKNS